VTGRLREWDLFKVSLKVEVRTESLSPAPLQL
jgi:hypothetical protein